MADEKKTPPVAEEFSQHFIDSIQQGTAPWIKAWKAGEFVPPHNPISGTVYKGPNLVRLGGLGYRDPRFMTLLQANEAGMTVKEGSKGIRVMFWKFDKQEPVLDETGRPMLDAEGRAVMETKPLERPMLSVSHVFHASQIDGISDMTPMPPLGNAHERAETILRNSGASISHDTRNRAYYSLDSDLIHLPPKVQFADAGEYYATALHELAHWTGGPDRLNRQFGTVCGSESYAREELRAEIASLMIAGELGLPYNPDAEHQGYGGLWIKQLKEDPFEIVRACRDAEKIKDMVLGMEKERYMGKETDREASAVSMADAGAAPAAQKRWLDVPFKEKDRASAAGARWDRKARCWFAPEGVDMERLSAWLPGRDIENRNAFALSPQAEFAERLREAGLDLRGELPVMDGKFHRVPLLDRPGGGKDGTYKAFLDGRPSGWFQNFVTGETDTWKYSGHKLDAAQLAQLKADAARNQEQRQAILKEQHAHAAKRSYVIWKDERNAWATEDHPYLKAKGVLSFGLKVDAQGNLLIPGVDVDGRVQTLLTVVQKDSQENLKRFERGSRVEGAFFVINPKEADMNRQFYIAEGYATAASIHMATGQPVVCAFNSGNLKPVAEALRAAHPEAGIIICADNDHAVTRLDGQPYNVGVNKANEAAAAIGAIVLTPQLTEQERSAGLTDFNDLHVSRGLNELIFDARKMEQTALQFAAQARDRKAQEAQGQGKDVQEKSQGAQMAM